MDVAVGNVKKIIPTLNETSETLKMLKKKYPIAGRISNLREAAMNESLICFLRPVKDNEAPIEISANGRVAIEISCKLLLTNRGKL